jgi:hypothetical protein
MIAKTFTPFPGAKVFAIMVNGRGAWGFHDREHFYTPWSSKPFAIMETPFVGGGSHHLKAIARGARSGYSLLKSTVRGLGRVRGKSGKDFDNDRFS